jgi:acetylornithine deacetylase/succinyl-diaminopimelate desuccinylase-like protein
MEDSNLKDWVFKTFDENALPSLMDFVRIPNLSPGFDPEWDTNGHQEAAAKHLIEWAE